MTWQRNRKRHGIALIVAFVFLIPTTPAMAQVQAAGDLRDMCYGRGEFAGELKEKAEGVCWGFIAAVGEILSAGNTIAGIEVCAPMGSTSLRRGDIIQIVKGHLEYRLDDPEIPSSIAITLALAKAYPCE